MRACDENRGKGKKEVWCRVSLIIARGVYDEGKSRYEDLETYQYLPSWALPWKSNTFLLMVKIIH